MNERDRPTSPVDALQKIITGCDNFIRNNGDFGTALERVRQIAQAALANSGEPVRCTFAHNQLMGIFDCDFSDVDDDCNVHPGRKFKPTESDTNA